MTKYMKISLNFLSIAVLAYAVLVTPAFAISAVENGSTANTAPSTVDNHTTASQDQVAVADNGNTASPATADNGNTSAPASVSNGTTADAKAPATADNGNTSSPATADNGNTSALVTVDNGTTADKPAPITVDNGNTTGTPSNTNTGGGNTSGGGSNNTGGGSSGGGRSSRNNSSSNPTVTPVVAGGACSYLSTYLKFNGDNDASEVAKLQTFLKNTEKLDVDINGKFDEKTLDAVKAFQAKYVDETMAPWGVTTPTGEVYFTTKKKINEIVCKTNFNLTSEQLSTIESYKNSIENGVITTDDTDTTNATGTIQLSPEVGSNDDSQTASAAISRFGSKIWSFIKWIFGYN